MREKAKQRWEKAHSKGKNYFIFKFGGLYLGPLSFVLSFLSIIMFETLFYNSTFNYFSSWEFIERVGANAIAAYPTGVMWAWITWKTLEEKAKKTNSL